MIAYLDSSVILRLVLKEADPLREWPDVDRGVTSALAEVEVLRTMDRLRFSTPTLDSQGFAARREVAFRVLEGLETIEITRVVLARASQLLPTPLGTLEAIHLVSAMGWREQFEGLLFATHDLALAAAARASGLEVLGAKHPSRRSTPSAARSSRSTRRATRGRPNGSRGTCGEGCPRS